MAEFLRHGQTALLHHRLEWADVPPSLLEVMVVTNPRVTDLDRVNAKPFLVFTSLICSVAEEREYIERGITNKLLSAWIFERKRKSEKIVEFFFNMAPNNELAERFAVRLKKVAQLELDRRNGLIEKLPDEYAIEQMARDCLQMRQDGNTAENFPDYVALDEPYNHWPYNSPNSNVIAQFIRISYTLLRDGTMDWDSIPSDVLEIVLTDNHISWADSPPLAFLGILSQIGLENSARRKLLDDSSFTTNELIITTFIGGGDKGRKMNNKWLKKVRKIAQRELDRRQNNIKLRRPLKPFWQLAEEFFEEDLRMHQLAEDEGG